MDSKLPENETDQENAAQAVQDIQITIPPEIQRGAFANQTLISNTAEEFMLDFILVTPPTATMTARIVLTPAHAKRLVAALHENVRNYENNFGKIELAQSQDEPAGGKPASAKQDKTLN